MDKPTLSAAERFAAFHLEKEKEKAAALPDTPESATIRALINGEHVWVDVERLQTLHRLAVSYAGRAGAFVECGVAKGGSLAMMAKYAGDERLAWGFDSFEEMPDLTPADRGSGAMFVGVKCSGPQGEQAVAATFEHVGVPMGHVRIVKGWFSDTLPASKVDIGPIAILRVDADWYDATRCVLETLYDQVLPGGVVVIDDYGSFAGCRKAVDEFRAARECGELHNTPGTVEAYWFA